MAKRTNTKSKSTKPEKITLESDNVKIEVRPYEKKNLIGFATVILYDDIYIYNCKIVDGKNGYFLSMPSYEGSDDNYYNYAYINKDSDLSTEINDLVASLEEKELPFN